MNFQSGMKGVLRLIEPGGSRTAGQRADRGGGGEGGYEMNFGTSASRWTICTYRGSMRPKQNNFTSRKITLFTFLTLPHSQSRVVQSRIPFVWKCLFRFFYIQLACTPESKHWWGKESQCKLKRKESLVAHSLPPVSILLSILASPKVTQLMMLKFTQQHICRE